MAVGRAGHRRARRRLDHGAVLGSAEPADYDRGSQAVLDRTEVATTMHVGASLAAVTATDSTALAMLGSQMQLAGWLPGCVVTGVVAHASLRRRLLVRWVGALLALLTLASAGATLALGLPYSSGLIVPVCLTVLSAALLRQRRPR